MLGTILSIVGGVSEAINIYKFGSTLAKGSDAERVLGALDRIHATVERLSDNILYAPGIEGLSPAAGTAHRLGGLREARALLEPVQVALGGEIVSSGLIETPDKMERVMLENPWAVLEDVRPQHLAVRQVNPDKVPVLFVHQGVRYIGWQMRGALPVLFNCGLRDLPGLGASLTPEVWEKPPQQQSWQSPVPPAPAAQARFQGAGWLDKAKAFVTGPSGGPALIAPVARETRAVARPAWASGAGQDKFGLWADFALGDARQRMRWIKPGTFQMGSPEKEDGRFNDEGPRHEVRLTKGFWLGDTPVTQALWTAAMGSNPSSSKDPKRPVESVNWNDEQEFLKKMNARIPGLDLGLPTEAQWEYACRAGTEGANYARGGQKLADIAWFDENSGGQTHPVATKRCNDWGLYDMLGNVWERCADGRRGYTAKPVTDPAGPLDSASRALRGGSWYYYAGLVRAANRGERGRGYRSNDIGFRCCVSVR
jgi:formylglycine-generating enzyme required for sulfatase activity